MVKYSTLLQEKQRTVFCTAGQSPAEKGYTLWKEFVPIGYGVDPFSEWTKSA